MIRSCRLCLLIGLCGLSVTCGGAGTSPDAVVLPLRPGLQLLTLSGFAVSLDPALPACQPFGVPRDGTRVDTVVGLTQDGDEWVARSWTAPGDVELRLRASGSTASGYGVIGTMRGSARDMGLMGLVRDVSVSLGAAAGAGAAQVDGATASLTSSLVVGRVTGTLRFSDSQGTASACSAIQWSMQPY